MVSKWLPRIPKTSGTRPTSSAGSGGVSAAGSGSGSAASIDSFDSTRGIQKWCNGQGEGKQGGVTSSSAFSEMLAEFLVGTEFIGHVLEFLELHAVKTNSYSESKLGAGQFEHELAYSDLFLEFTQVFESKLEAFLASEGCEIQDVHQALSPENKEEEGFSQSLLHVLLTIFEYETFVELLRDTERRKYLETIAQDWRKTLL